MEVHVLASGSTGNATLIKMGEANILVDAGVSTKRIRQGMEAVGTAIEELDGVLITHEHRDHIFGLPVLTKKYGIPVFARPATWEAIARQLCPKEVASGCQQELGNSLELAGVKIEPFPISHDAVEPVGFCLYEGQEKCSIATDLGFVTQSVKNALALSDILVLEANHDVDMLKQGSYPWYLKQRILSNRGHLANTDTGWTLARLPRQETCQVFLAHMSQENNCPEIAEKTVTDILTEQGCRVGHEVVLHMTFPDREASVILAEEESG